MIVAADHPAISWLGAVEVERTAAGLVPWRIALADRPLLPQALLTAASKAAGVRLMLSTDATALTLDAGFTGPGAVPPVVEADGAARPMERDAQRRFTIAGLPAGRRTLRIWLPHLAVAEVRALELHDAQWLAPAADPPPLRWIHYGSSISHGVGASAPHLAWPVRVARAHGADLINLGMSGQCHLDPLLARRIARLAPARAISIKAGVNIQSASSLSPRTFRSGLAAFVRMVRDGHPDCPIAVVSAIHAPVRENLENKVGMTLAAMREEAAAAVADLHAAGDAAVALLDGHRLLAPGEHHLLPDLLHPSDDGHALIAERFSAELGPLLFQPSTP